MVRLDPRFISPPFLCWVQTASPPASGVVGTRALSTYPSLSRDYLGTVFQRFRQERRRTADEHPSSETVFPSTLCRTRSPR